MGKSPEIPRGQRAACPRVFPGRLGPLPGHPGRIKQIGQNLGRQLGLHPAEGGLGRFGGGQPPLPAHFHQTRHRLPLGGGGGQHKGQRRLPLGGDVQTQPQGHGPVGHPAARTAKGGVHVAGQGRGAQGPGSAAPPGRPRIRRAPPPRKPAARHMGGSSPRRRRVTTNAWAASSLWAERNRREKAGCASTSCRRDRQGSK